MKTVLEIPVLLSSIAVNGIDCRRLSRRRVRWIRWWAGYLSTACPRLLSSLHLYLLRSHLALFVCFHLLIL